MPRPIRPATSWKGDNILGKDPASTTIKYRPIDRAAHAKFSAPIRETAGSTDKTLKLYQGAFHDLLNDFDKSVVMEDIKGWIHARLPTA